MATWSTGSPAFNREGENRTGDKFLSRDMAAAVVSVSRPLTRSLIAIFLFLPAQRDISDVETFCHGGIRAPVFSRQVETRRVILIKRKKNAAYPGFCIRLHKCIYIIELYDAKGDLSYLLYRCLYIKIVKDI